MLEGLDYDIELDVCTRLLQLNDYEHLQIA